MQSSVERNPLYNRDILYSLRLLLTWKELYLGIGTLSKWHYLFVNSKQNARFTKAVIKNSLHVSGLITDHVIYLEPNIVEEWGKILDHLFSMVKYSEPSASIIPMTENTHSMTKILHKFLDRNYLLSEENELKMDEKQAIHKLQCEVILLISSFMGRLHKVEQETDEKKREEIYNKRNDPRFLDFLTDFISGPLAFRSAAMQPKWDDARSKFIDWRQLDQRDITHINHLLIYNAMSLSTHLNSNKYLSLNSVMNCLKNTICNETFEGCLAIMMSKIDFEGAKNKEFEDVLFYLLRNVNQFGSSVTKTLTASVTLLIQYIGIMPESKVQDFLPTILTNMEQGFNNPRIIACSQFLSSQLFDSDKDSTDRAKLRQFAVENTELANIMFSYAVSSASALARIINSRQIGIHEYNHCSSLMAYSLCLIFKFYDTDDCFRKFWTRHYKEFIPLIGHVLHMGQHHDGFTERGLIVISAALESKDNDNKVAIELMNQPNIVRTIMKVNQQMKPNHKNIEFARDILCVMIEKLKDDVPRMTQLYEFGIINSLISILKNPKIRNHDRTCLGIARAVHAFKRESSSDPGNEELLNTMKSNCEKAGLLELMTTVCVYSRDAFDIFADIWPELSS